MLHFPAVLIRTSTERPEALDAGTIVLGGITGRDVLQSMELAMALFRDEPAPDLPKEYTALNVSSRVIRIIESYARIVNMTTWRKHG